MVTMAITRGSPSTVLCFQRGKLAVSACLRQKILSRLGSVLFVRGCRGRWCQTDPDMWRSRKAGRLVCGRAGGELTPHHVSEGSRSCASPECRGSNQSGVPQSSVSMAGPSPMLSPLETRHGTEIWSQPLQFYRGEDGNLREVKE